MGRDVNDGLTDTAPASPVITATADGTGSSPDTVTVTIYGLSYIVDVTTDRDDWQLPDVADGHEHRVMWAIDDAVEEYVAANDDHEGRERATHRYRSRRAA